MLLLIVLSGERPFKPADKDYVNVSLKAPESTYEEANLKKEFKEVWTDFKKATDSEDNVRTCDRRKIARVDILNLGYDIIG